MDVPNVPKCRMPVLRSYRIPEVSGSDIESVPNLTFKDRTPDAGTKQLG